MQKLQKSLSSFIKLHVVGWTEDIDEYMRIADFIISKPGGSTTSECLVLNKKLIAVQPIPGQEERNAQFLLETNRGYIVHSEEDIVYYLQHGKKNSLRKHKKNPSEMILKKILEK